MFKKNYSIRLTPLYILPFHFRKKYSYFTETHPGLITEHDLEEKRVFLTTEVIKISAINLIGTQRLLKSCAAPS